MINRQFGDVTSSVLVLIDLVLTIPATSVEAERSFSVMKRVKTDYRNKLRNPAMNDLMRIILLSPSVAILLLPSNTGIVLCNAGSVVGDLHHRTLTVTTVTTVTRNVPHLRPCCRTQQLCERIWLKLCGAMDVH